MEIFKKRMKYIEAQLPSTYKSAVSGPKPKFGCYNCDHAIVCKNHITVKGCDETWCNHGKVIIPAHIPEYNVLVLSSRPSKFGRSVDVTKHWTDKIREQVEFYKPLQTDSYGICEFHPSYTINPASSTTTVSNEKDLKDTDVEEIMRTFLFNLAGSAWSSDHYQKALEVLKTMELDEKDLKDFIKIVKSPPQEGSPK